MPPENVMSLQTGTAQPCIAVLPVWRESAGSAQAAPYRGDGVAVGALVLVLVVHAILLLLLITKVMQIAPPEEKSGGGPLRVRLVASHPETAQAVPVPPKPETKPIEAPEKKVVASEAPQVRKVEQPKKTAPEAKPEPQVQTPAPAVPPAAQQVPAEAPAVAKPAVAAAGNPEHTGVGAQAAPKEVGQLACRIPKPDYPRAARRQGQSGQVMVRLVVNEQGRVATAEVTRGSGFAALDEAARNAALAGSCEPYREGGNAIRVTALQAFNFVPGD
jgi:protein TonB